MKTFKILIVILLMVPLSRADAQSSTPIDKITASYIDLKNALVAGNGKLAQDKAKILLTDLSDKPEQGLTADQQKTMDTYLDKLKFDSRHMSETADIDHQREHFSSLSQNMYMLLKKLNANSATMYVQYCPMKKSFWLSETENIRNPYYSKQMMTCGSTKAVLKPAAK